MGTGTQVRGGRDGRPEQEAKQAPSRRALLKAQPDRLKQQDCGGNGE